MSQPVDAERTVTPSIRGSYALASLTFSLMVALTNTYAQIFLTDIAFFPTAMVGTILFVGRILDAFSVPVTGAVLERSHLKWGKYRPWLVIGAALTMIFNALFFVAWNGATGQVIAKAILACLIYALFCASTNLVYTAYTSLNSSLTDDPRQRVGLSSLRSQGGAVGNILAGYLLLPMIAFFGGSDRQTVKGYFLTAVITGILLVVGYGSLALAVGKREALPPQPVRKEGKSRITGKLMLRLVFTNRPLMCLFFADVLRLLTYLIALSIFPYFFIYVAKTPGAAPMLFGTTSIAMLVGATLIRSLCKKMSMRNVYLLGLGILCASFLVAGLFKSNLYIMVGALVVGFVGYAFGSTVSTAMYTDVIDYGEVRYGVNARSLYFSLFQLSIKVSAIFSTGIAGFGMAQIGYQAGVEPTEKVISGIYFICLALPVGLCLLAIVCLLLYNLNDEKIRQVRETLRQSHS